ncbi:MAG: hypothetical protein WCI72_04090 [archaeon]
MVSTRDARLFVSMLYGSAVGCVGATVATVWGGYEIGSTLNDALHITNFIGRGALDLFMMGLVAVPAYSAGFKGGAVCGYHVADYIIRAEERKNTSRNRTPKETPNKKNGCEGTLEEQWEKVKKEIF